MAAITPFVLASMFPIVDAIPLERRSNSTGVSAGSTQLGPWTLPFWAYALIIVFSVIAGVGLLVWLIKFLISLGCWALCFSVDTRLAEKAEHRQEQHQNKDPIQQLHDHQNQYQQNLSYQRHDGQAYTAHTQVYGLPHIHNYANQPSHGADINNQARAVRGNIAPYHHFTIPGPPHPSNPPPRYQHQEQQQQQKYAGPEAFPLMFVPASMLSPKPYPPPSPSSRPSSELDPIAPYPRPPGLEHKYRASH